MDRLKSLLVNVCRLLLGAVLVLSGFVKAVDPLGMQYKLQEYAAALPIAVAVPDRLTLLLAVAIPAFEFTLGVLLLFAIRRRVVSRLSLAFMVVMTCITVWTAIAHPVSDCGCFGDAITLTDGESLAKNIVLTACAIVVALRPLRMRRRVTARVQWIIGNYSVLFILITSALSLYYLPLYDFRPYHEGADIRAGMEMPDGAEGPQFRTTFILTKDGQEREFTIDDYPDSTWTFVDSRTVQTSKGYEPPVHDFAIVRHSDGEDITDEVLDSDGYTFLLVAPLLEQADDANFGDIELIYEYAQESGTRFLCLTASGDDAIARWQTLTGAEYEFCATDMRTLRTMIRSNPGLMLLHGSTIVKKWSHNALPKAENLPSDIASWALRCTAGGGTWGKTAKILLWFVLPLLLLTLADRLWSWTLWLRRLKKTNTIYLILKNKKMSKKIVAGNWKMNLTLQEGVALAKELNETLTADKPNCDVVICTPFIHLATIAQCIDQSVIGLGAENCADKEKGAYTGEVSAAMVKSTGATYVILGHSERREYYHETPEILKEKVLLALKNGLKVIFCIGETLEEREADKQNEVVKAELEGSVFNLSEEEFKNIIIAYEPIWAIGTGKTATADQAEEIHAYIRGVIAEKYGKDIAAQTSILYGGSCKAGNAPELFAKPDIDGGLIGGASLKAADFKGIIDAWK